MRILHFLTNNNGVEEWRGRSCTTAVIDKMENISLNLNRISCCYCCHQIIVIVKQIAVCLSSSLPTFYAPLFRYLSMYYQHTIYISLSYKNETLPFRFSQQSIQLTFSILLITSSTGEIERESEEKRAHNHYVVLKYYLIFLSFYMFLCFLFSPFSFWSVYLLSSVNYTHCRCLCMCACQLKKILWR